MRAMKCGRLQLCLVLAALSWGITQAQKCTSVNDILPQLPKDLQELIKGRMDVLAFHGTFFLPTEEAWRNKDLDDKIYSKERLGAILDFAIVDGVRLAKRPAVDLKNGTLQLDTRYKDSPQVLCITADRPNSQLDVDILVTGKPSGNDTSQYFIAGTGGNTFKAGDGEITIVKVYSDKKLQSALAAKNATYPKDAKRDMDKGKYGDHMNSTLKDIVSWEPANVVKVVQCELVDIIYVDRVLTPCPLCGKKCTAAIMSTLIKVALPVTSAFAVGLAIAGYVAICCGCNVCSNAGGFCGCFWKFVCSSLVLVVILLELLVLGSFAGYAYYVNDFWQENKNVPGVDKWRPYFIWAVVGAILTGLVVIGQVWSFFSQMRKRRAEKKHKQFYSQPPPPMYQPVGAVPPMSA